MYFADVSEENNLTIYKNLLDGYLENQNSQETKAFFINVIKTAHQLAIKTIAENRIDNTIYNLVTTIVDHNNINNREYFENIDPENIGDLQFKTLSGILSSLISNYEPA
jgi:hypothetical protein